MERLVIRVIAYLALAFFLAVLLAGCKQGLVYTSSPRDLRPIEGGAQDRSNWQRVSDVQFINHGFEESDVEFFTVDGDTFMVHDCTTSEVVCAAQEPRTSPDGKWIAYSVSFGDYLEEVNGAKVIHDVKEAFIYLYNVRTEKSHRIPGQAPGVINRMPDWLSNQKLVYSSNAAGVYPIKDQFGYHRGRDEQGRPRWGHTAYGVSQAYGYTSSGKSMQLWTMNRDGSNQVNITPEESMAIRPTVLRHPKHGGRILFSCWNSQEDKAFDAPRHSNNPGTNVNKYWVCSINGNGTDKTVVLGAHKHLSLEKFALLPEGTKGGEGRHELLALRSVGELADGSVCVVSYYRGNHMGGGPIVCFDIDDHHVEGALPAAGAFTPRNLRIVTPYANGQDILPHMDRHGRPTGKSANPFLLPGGGLGITRVRGWCYPIFHPYKPQSSDIGGEPLCDKGIYRVKQMPVTDAFDLDQLEPIVDNPLKNEWDAAAVVPGKKPPAPAPLDPDDGCHLQVVDARKSELVPRDPYQWGKLWAQTAHQGNAVKAHDPNYLAENIFAMAIYGLEPWHTTYPDQEFREASNKHGYRRKWLLGVAPIHEDGSLWVEVPCERPIQMSGSNRDMAVIAHDAMPHSFRRGETKQCLGCHEGHSEQGRARYPAPVGELFKSTLAFKAGPVQLVGASEVRWPDVQPIITERCGGCHEGFQNDDLLYSRIAEDYEQKDFPWMKRQPTHNGDFKLPRPYFSGLLARFPGWSPLYWYCMGERLDGYKNDDHQGDIDYHEGHPQAGSPSECRAIAQWINQGVQL